MTVGEKDALGGELGVSEGETDGAGEAEGEAEGVMVGAVGDMDGADEGARVSRAKHRVALAMLQRGARFRYCNAVS